MLVELKMWIIPIAAVIPLIMGFIWYHPKVFGTAWMNAAGMSDDDMNGGNMGLIFGLSYVFACMMGFALLGTVIHQMGFQSMIIEAEGWMEEGSPLMNAANTLLEIAGDNYRSFKHGSLHGFILGLFFVLPLMATNALFERKGWKYIWINVGYWTISLALMGGIICQYA